MNATARQKLINYFAANPPSGGTFYTGSPSWPASGGVSVRIYCVDSQGNFRTGLIKSQYGMSFRHPFVQGGDPHETRFSWNTNALIDGSYAEYYYVNSNSTGNNSGWYPYPTSEISSTTQYNSIPTNLKGNLNVWGSDNHTSKGFYWVQNDWAKSLYYSPGNIVEVGYIKYPNYILRIMSFYINANSHPFYGGASPFGINVGDLILRHSDSSWGLGDFSVPFTAVDTIHKIGEIPYSRLSGPHPDNLKTAAADTLFDKARYSIVGGTKASQYILTAVARNTSYGDNRTQYVRFTFEQLYATTVKFVCNDATINAVNLRVKFSNATIGTINNIANNQSLGNLPTLTVNAFKTLSNLSCTSSEQYVGIKSVTTSLSGTTYTITITFDYTHSLYTLKINHTGTGYSEVSSLTMKLTDGSLNPTLTNNGTFYSDAVTSTISNKANWAFVSGNYISNLTISSVSISGKTVTLNLTSNRLWINFAFKQESVSTPISLAALGVKFGYSIASVSRSLSLINGYTYLSQPDELSTLESLLKTKANYAITTTPNGRIVLTRVVVTTPTVSATGNNKYNVEIYFELIPTLSLTFVEFRKDTAVVSPSEINILDLSGEVLQSGQPCWNPFYNIVVRVSGIDWPVSANNVTLVYSIYGTSLPQIVDDKRYLCSPGYSAPATAVSGDTFTFQMSVLKKTLVPNTTTNVKIRAIVTGFSAVYSEITVPIKFIETIDTTSNFKINSISVKNILTTTLNTNSFPDTVTDYINHFQYTLDSRIPNDEIKMLLTATQGSLTKTITVTNPVSLPTIPFAGYNLKFKDSFGDVISDIGLADITFSGKLQWTSPKSNYTYSSPDVTVPMKALPTKHPNITNPDGTNILVPAQKKYSFDLTSQQGLINMLLSLQVKSISTNSLAMSNSITNTFASVGAVTSLTCNVPDVFYQAHGKSKIDIDVEYVLQDVFYDYNGVLATLNQRTLKLNVADFISETLNYDINITNFDISDIIYGTVLVAAQKQMSYLQECSFEFWLTNKTTTAIDTSQIFTGEALNLTKSFAYAIDLLQRGIKYDFTIKLIATKAFGVQILSANPTQVSKELSTEKEVRTQNLMCFFDINLLEYIIKGNAIGLFGPYSSYRVLCTVEDADGEILGKFELPTAIKYSAIKNTHDEIEFFHSLNALLFPDDFSFRNRCVVTVSYSY